MIDGLSVLGVITARGGSKGLPRKNLREVAGRTLLERTIAAGRAARTIDRLILSSDDPETIQAATLLGCEVPFIRPEGLARDDTRSIDVVHHALAAIPEAYDLIVLLQPTSPLRTGENVDAAVALCARQAAPACVAVCRADKPPQWTYRLDARLGLHPVLPDAPGAARRQDLPLYYVVNGAVYVARCDWIRDRDGFVGPGTVAYVMPKERSLDVDAEIDLVIAEAVERWLLRRDGEGAEPVQPRSQNSL